MGNLNIKLDKNYIIVSGSDIPAVNGIYRRAGIENDKPFYLKTPVVAPYSEGSFGDSNLKISIQGSFPIVWSIANETFVGYYYTANSSFETPDLVPSWSISPGASGNISVKVFSGSTSIKKQNLGGGKLSAKLIQSASPFSPASIAGLKLWLKADAGVTEAGGVVTDWADQSGNSKNATIYTGLPTLTTINSNKFVVFDGSSAMTGANIVTATPCTIISVIQWTQFDDIDVWFQQWDGDVLDNITLYTAVECGWRVYNGFNLDSTDSVWQLNQTQLAATIVDQSSSKHFHNGTAAGEGDSGSITPAGDYFLGIWRGADTPKYFKIAEILVYDSALSTQDREAVEAYLNDKYAIY